MHHKENIMNITCIITTGDYSQDKERCISNQVCVSCGCMVEDTFANDKEEKEYARKALCGNCQSKTNRV